MRKNLSIVRNLPRSPVGSYVQKASGLPFRYSPKNFLSSSVFQWAAAYWKYRIGKKHPFQIYKNSNGIFTMAGETKVSIAGDWGTGTDEAFAVANRMQESHPHYTIHLGDIYYVGDEKDTNENFLGIPSSTYQPCKWPSGSLGQFALQGNHEMYARGYAYFDKVLPTMGTPTQKQEASFFCLENDFWRIIGLDTGYNSVGAPLVEEVTSPSCLLTNEQLDWLKSVVQLDKDKRGLVFLTHHQYYSAFEKQYPKLGEQLAKFTSRPVLWFWGHEHRMAVYGQSSLGSGVKAWGRCIGHGGMPIELEAKIKNPRVPLVFTDKRVYPNDENLTIGYNGHVNLSFVDNKLSVDYVDIMGGQQAPSESWAVDNGLISQV